MCSNIHTDARTDGAHYARAPLADERFLIRNFLEHCGAANFAENDFFGIFSFQSQLIVNT